MPEYEIIDDSTAAVRQVVQAPCARDAAAQFGLAAGLQAQRVEAKTAHFAVLAGRDPVSGAPRTFRSVAAQAAAR